MRAHSPEAVRLYHVTHKSRVNSIRTLGLAGQFDERGKGLVWLCDAARLEWACPHIADRHKWRAEELAILTVRVREKDLVRRREGIFTTYIDIEPENLWVSYLP